MIYFKIGNNDLSSYVSGLDISNSHNFISQTNAAGDTVCDYINAKRNITVTFIPMSEATASTVLNKIDFANSLSFRNPKTAALETNVSTICPDNSISYYTIQDSRKLLKSFTVTFKEL